MNNKKYQVFISSTYSDLIEERKKVMDILLMADCIPAGMEAFVATDEEQFEVIKKVIDLCDYYVLIIGHRYGSVNSQTGLSYTEMEFDYAIEKEIPVLVFAIDDSVPVPVDRDKIELENEDKLRTFRKKALNNRLGGMWKNIDDLSGKVAVSIMKAKDTIDRPGWQRGTEYDEASLRRTIMKLQEENSIIKSELAKANDTIRAFTELSDIEFENYEVKIDYHYKPLNSSYERTGCIEKKLPEVFQTIATEMLDVMLAEHAIEDAIKHKYTKIRGSIVYYSDSQQIKNVLIQLRALGLIYSSWSKEKNILFWGLTKKGILLRDKMIVKKKQQVKGNVKKDEPVLGE